MKLINGWLFEENREAVNEILECGKIDLAALVNIQLGNLTFRVKDKPLQFSRKATIEFFRYIWQDDSTFLEPLNTIRYIRLLNSRPAEYEKSYLTTVNKACEAIVLDRVLPTSILNTVQYHNHAAQDDLRVCIALTDGWIHPLSDFEYRQGAYEVNNLWALACLCAAQLTGRYDEKEKPFKSSRIPFDYEYMNILRQRHPDLIHAAKYLDTEFLILVNTIKHNNEGLHFLSF